MSDERITVRLPAKLAAELKKEARALGLGLSAYVRMTLIKRKGTPDEN